MNFYFTYANNELYSEKYPFQHGCTKVVANNKYNAIETFNKKHPVYECLVTCSRIYNEQKFEEACNELYKGYRLESFSKVHETLYQYQITLNDKKCLESLERSGWDFLARDDDGELYTYDKEEPSFDEQYGYYNPVSNFKFIGCKCFDFIETDSGIHNIHDILENSEVIDDVQTK